MYIMFSKTSFMTMSIKNYSCFLLRLGLKGKFLPESCYMLSIRKNFSNLLNKRKFNPKLYELRTLHSSKWICQEENEVEEEERSDEVSQEITKPKRKIDPSLDRSRVIPVETSMKYLESKAYKTTYGDDPVWKRYRRNFKGQIPPRKTIATCIIDQRVITGNPCPICRDEYLVVDYHNVKLLKQFISPYTGKTLPYGVTGLCQEKQLKVEVEIEKAKTRGLLPFYIPFREYSYEEFYNPNDK